MIVEVFIFLLVHKNNPGKEVHTGAILPNHIICLLTLEGQDKEQSWRLLKPVFQHQVLVLLLDEFLAHQELLHEHVIVWWIVVFKDLPE